MQGRALPVREQRRDPAFGLTRLDDEVRQLVAAFAICPEQLLAVTDALGEAGTGPPRALLGMDEDRADLGVRTSDIRRPVSNQRDLLSSFGVAKATPQRR